MRVSFSSEWVRLSVARLLVLTVWLPLKGEREREFWPTVQLPKAPVLFPSVFQCVCVCVQVDNWRFILLTMRKTNERKKENYKYFINWRTLMSCFFSDCLNFISFTFLNVCVCVWFALHFSTKDFSSFCFFFILFFIISPVNWANGKYVHSFLFA